MVDGVVFPTALIRYVLDSVPSNLDSLLDKLCKEVKELTESVLLEDATETDVIDGNTPNDGTKVDKNQIKVEQVDMKVLKDFDNQHWTRLQPELQKQNINPFSQPLNLNRLAIRKDVNIGFDVEGVNDAMLKHDTDSDKCNEFIDVVSANALYSSAKSDADLSADIGETSEGYNRGQLCISYINKLLTGKSMSTDDAIDYDNKNKARRDKLEKLVQKTPGLDNVINQKGGFDRVYKDFVGKHMKELNSFTSEQVQDAFIKFIKEGK